MAATSVSLYEWKNQIEIRTREILNLYKQASCRIATAESCTGGLLAAVLTEQAGSSTVFERGFVTYSNESKSELLGVPLQLIEEVGAVSQDVARAMAYGALHNSKADFSVSITGIAGPTGGTVEKPIGLVYFGMADKNGTLSHEEERFPSTLSRQEIRSLSVSKALDILQNVFNS